MTSKQVRFFAAGFIAAFFASLLIWWLSGYNFDTRAPEVAFGAVFVLSVGFLGGCFALVAGTE